MKTLDLLQPNQAQDLFSDDAYVWNSYPLSEFIFWIEMELRPTENVRIALNDRKNTYVHFIYNLENTIGISSKGSSCKERLKTFQSALIHERNGQDTFIDLKPDRGYKFCIVQMAKYNDDKENTAFFPEFEHAIQELFVNHYFMHTGLPNLKIGEYVKELMEMSKEELSDRLMASGYVNILLSLKLKQFISFRENPLQTSSLTLTEIKRVKEISEIINNNPEATYSIDDICKQWGLNANKLQLGFKEMHGRTVCNFINHLRLLKAEELLKSSDMNVSEIVYSLGWTSRSYFCKIFKEKFQCSPKTYQLQLLGV